MSGASALASRRNDGHALAARLAVAVGPGDGTWVVPLVMGAVLSISGVVIFGRVPSILDPLLAEP
jgi:hypothetical protein